METAKNSVGNTPKTPENQKNNVVQTMRAGVAGLALSLAVSGGVQAGTPNTEADCGIVNGVQTALKIDYDEWGEEKQSCVAQTEVDAENAALIQASEGKLAQDLKNLGNTKTGRTILVGAALSEF